jgi:thiosulfate dehydrogenase
MISMPSWTSSWICSLLVVPALAACDLASGRTADSPAPGRGETKPTAPIVSFDATSWRPPAITEIPGDSLGASIRRGLALITRTADSLPYYAPGRVACTNCHLDGGRNADAAPLTGSYARFPKYMERTGAVVGLADRVNYCFTRSLAGNRLPVESREMQDILAYLAWLSTGVPIGHGKELPGADGLRAMPAGLVGDRSRGAAVFAGKCVACHGADGQGNSAVSPAIPPLWGAKSFSVGASMSRQGKAASFIWHNMPFGQPKSLSPQEAFDVAAFVTSQPRLDSPGKEADWPAAGAPADVPYATTNHKAYLPPPLLPRRSTREAIVPPPQSLTRRRGVGRTTSHEQ